MEDSQLQQEDDHGSKYGDAYTCATAPLLTESRSDAESTVLDLEDYSRTTWTSIVSYGVPTLGIATFLVLTHPLLFVAGATVSLLGMGGAYAMDAAGDCSSMCCHKNVTPSGKETTATTQTEAKKISQSLPNELSIATVMSTCSCDEPELMNQIILSEDELEPDDDHDEGSVPGPMEHMMISKAEFSSLHARDFFKIFFGDDAPFCFKDFQKERGDINIEYSRWGDSVERVILFQTPTRTPFFGPTHASATKMQVLKQCSKTCVVLESSTTLKDIPFSDRFVVQERWVFQSNREKICAVTISAQVVFTKSCPFESQIVTKSMSTLRESLSVWCDMAHRALAVTRRQQHAHDVKLDDEIEVEYRHERRISYVLGEEDYEDWEMDPLHKQPSPIRRPRSLSAFRRSLSHSFLKKQ
jgi:hypothetical protein